MTMRNTLFAACLVGAAVTACGGGGGGSPAPAPAPAPSPSNVLPPPTGLDAARLTLSQQVPQSCAPNISCLDNAHVAVDASGEMTAVWAEANSAAPQRLMAATAGAGATNVLSNAIEQTFASNPARVSTLRGVGTRRFVLFDQVLNTGTDNRARVIDTPLGAAPTALPAVNVPLQFGLGNIVQDSSQALYAVTLGQSAPFPTFNLGGVNLTAVSAQPLPYAEVEYSAIGEFTHSIDPRALIAVRGKETLADSRQIYLADLRLMNGAVLATLKISQQTFENGFGFVACNGVEPIIAVRSTATGNFAVAWRQLNVARTGCDLNVLGTIVNDGVNRVANYAVSGLGAELVVAWEEFLTNNTRRLMFSRRDPNTLAWSPAMRIIAPLANEESQQFLITTAGPGGTLAIVASTSPVGGGVPIVTVSKFVGGNWTTVTSTRILTPKAIAINASGQGAVISQDADTSCSGLCYRLYAYRF